MKYISIKIHNQLIAIPSEKYSVEATQINKIKPDVKRKGLRIGEINLRGQNIDVIDISKMFHKRNLKRFDGMLIVESKYAIIFEGFYKVINDLTDEKVVELDAIKL